MIRQVDLKEISDGKLYGSNDLVKADCGDCMGCHACCCGMGRSIVLDPLDVLRLMTGLGKSFEELLAGPVELNVADGIILPNLKMQGESERCGFLDENGRCAVHAFRPGICRLFPLGRYYENGGFQYFIQVHECRNEKRTKVKKWIDTPDVKNYEKYICGWHYFLVDMEAYLREKPEAAKEVSMYILQQFYLQPYSTVSGETKQSGVLTDEDVKEFYRQFESRLSRAREIFGK